MFWNVNVVVEDDPRNGRPKGTAKPEMVKEIDDLFLAHWRLKVTQLVKSEGIWVESFNCIKNISSISAVLVDC